MTFLSFSHNKIDFLLSAYLYCLQSILSYNGGAIVAMKGDNCVAIATDLRFGIQAQTLALDFEVKFVKLEI
jgi:hypothetical protein